MPCPIHHLLADESGAVSVEWVVLTAIAAAFGYIVSNTLGAGPPRCGGRDPDQFPGHAGRAVADPRLFRLTPQPTTRQCTAKPGSNTVTGPAPVSMRAGKVTGSACFSKVSVPRLRGRR